MYVVYKEEIKLVKNTANIFVFEKITFKRH